MAGALALLGEDENWEQFGDMTVEEAAQIMRDMLLRWYDEPCAAAEVPTPYWDDATDVDDSAPAEEQTWYGHMEGATFVEDLGWNIASGMVAYGLSPQAAVLFRTFAPKFRLAWLANGQGGAVKVIIDDVLAFVVDTFSEDPSIIERDVIGNPELTEHTILQVLDAV